MDAGIVKKKFMRNLKDYGLLVALNKSLTYVVRVFYEHKTYRIYMIDLENFQYNPSPKSGFVFRIISKDDTAVIQQIEDMEEWLQGKLSLKLENHGLCFVALDEENVAGFNLVAFGRVFIPLINMERILEDNEAWSEQITVHRDYRRRGLATELRYRVFNELKRRGIKRFYGGTLISNIPSLRLARKVGFRYLVDVRYIKVFNFRRWIHKKLTDETA